MNANIFSDDALSTPESQTKSALRAYRGAVLGERERCAVIAEEAWQHYWLGELRTEDVDKIRKVVGGVIAAAIRSGK